MSHKLSRFEMMRLSESFVLSYCAMLILYDNAYIHLAYIQPGNPQQNAYIERFNRTARQEWLEENIFETIEEAQEIGFKWLWTYNTVRPNMANGGRTPAMNLKQAKMAA